MECEKEADPTLELGEDNDIHTTKITLAIVFGAFIISPMTQCLGPVLELNVSIYFPLEMITNSLASKIHISGLISCHSTSLHFTGIGLYPT